MAAPISPFKYEGQDNIAAGKPMPRRPKYVPPAEYKPDPLNEMIDEYIPQLIGTPFPKNIKKYLEADWKKSFTVIADADDYVAAQKVSDYDLQQYDDVPDLYGPSLAINVLDLAKDPVETIKKTSKAWLQEIVNTTDFESSVKSDLYRLALSSDPPKTKAGSYDMNLAVEAIRGRTATVGRVTRGSPLGLTRVYDPVRFVGELDAALKRMGGPTPPVRGALSNEESKNIDYVNSAYKDVADSALKFNKSVKAGPKREASYSNLVRNSGKAIATDIQARFAGNLNEYYKDVGDNSGYMRNLTAQVFNGLTADESKTARSFLANQRIAEDLNTLSTQLSTLSNFLEADAATLGRGAGTGFPKFPTKILDKLDDSEALFSLYLNPALDIHRDPAILKDIKKAQAAVKRIKKNRGAIQTVVSNYTAAKTAGQKYPRTGVSSRMLRISLERDIKVLKGENHALSHGVAGRVARRSIENTLLPNTALTKLIDDHNIEGAKVARAWNHRWLIERERESTEDLVNAFVDGKLFETYVWKGLILKRIEYITPGYLVRNIKERTHSFFLIVDETLMGNPEAGILPSKKALPGANALMQVLGIKNKIKLSINGIGGVSIIGDPRLGLASETLLGLRGAGEIKDTVLNAVFDAAKRDIAAGVTAAKLGSSRFADTLYKLYIGGEIPEGLLPKVLLAEGTVEAEIGALYGSFEKFISYLKSQKINVDRMTLSDFLEALSKHNSNIPVTKKMIGVLEVFRDKATSLQKAILRNPVVGKAIKTFFTWKTIISEAIADAVAGAFEFLSGGTLSFLLPAIRKITKFLVYFGLNRVEAILKALWRSITKLDFEDLEKEIYKTMVLVFKLSLVVIIPMIIIPIVIGVLIMLIFLTTISPMRQNTTTGFVAVSYDTGDPTAVGSCPLESPIISTYSFDPSDVEGASPLRHGSNTYWEYVDPDNPCSFPIPSEGSCNDNSGSCGPISLPTSVCATSRRQTPYYGYALDVVSGSGNNTVYFPVIQDIDTGDIVEEWEVVGGPYALYDGDWGYALTFEGVDAGGNRYKLHLAHLDSGAQRYSLGQSISTLSSGQQSSPITPLFYWITDTGKNNTHLHIELAINGTYVKPEDYLCNGSTPTIGGGGDDGPSRDGVLD